MAWVGLVHGKADHLVAGLRAELVGVDVEHAGPLAVQGPGKIESGRSVSRRLCHALDDELRLWDVVEKLQEMRVDLVLQDISEAL